MALAQIPGPDAAKARVAMPPPKPVVKSKAAEVASFSEDLTRNPEDADELIAAALRSSNELLAGAALRRIRAGAGSPSLLQLCGNLPAGREDLLCEALAVRADAGNALHDHLLKHASNGNPQPQTVITLGRMLRPSDLPVLLKMAADETKPELAKAALTSISRGTDPGIAPALIQAAGLDSTPAIEALVLRRAVEEADALATLARADRPTISAAAWKALGSLMKPDQLAGILDELLKSEGKPHSAPLLKLVWDLARRHPDPVAAAVLLETSSASAPEDVKTSLLQYAGRIRPKNTPKQIPLDLPKVDDRLALGPNGCEQVIYLNSGSFSEAKSGNVVIRRTSGDSYTFGPVPHPLASVDFGKQVTYEISGLDPAGDYVLGLSAWDADQSKRVQALDINGASFLPDFVPLAWHADKPTFARIHVPLSRAAGKLTVTMKSVSGPNAVVSEIWLLRRGPRSNKRVLVLTGDDYPAHLWRETGPRFVEMLREDPRLEVTLSESPALLGSPALSSYDAVFLHFKNYADRLPVSEAAWKNLESYVNGGGGLVIAHFGCGAAQEWSGFVNVAGRVWDPKKRGHDPYGAFLVRILNAGHPATAGIKDFTTNDELYTCLAGETKIDVLADATSKVDQSVHPMAFVLHPGKGRVFHCPLGHNLGALEADGVRKLYLQGTLWAAGP
jgi:type 1 glutamine amidotransferase